MASLKKIHLTILSLLFFGPLFAQTEICDNGIDDDGDGLIDCFDNNSTIGTACSGSSDCDSFYFGNAVECTDSTNANTFNIDLKWASPNKSAHNKSSVAIGDLDNDGTPEVVVTNHENNTLNVIDGATGSWLYSVNVGFNIGAGVAIANVEDDDCAEIFIYRQKNSRLEAWNCDLTTRLWTANSGFGRAHVPSLADFNQDGYPELYHGNEILDPMTGAKIINGTGNWKTETSGGSVAVDIFPDSFCADCSGLELVDGKYVYAINITAGTKTLLKNMDDYLTGGSWYPKIAYNRNFTMGSVADYNLDGHIDLLIPGAFGSGNSGTSSIFFWDIVNDNVIRYADPQNNFTRGSGRINIADMDGDGNLNASFVSNQYLYCLNEDMSLRWRKSIKEGSSGFTGCSVFDFNGDGVFEVVYRSESTLHIIDGDDGTSRKTIYCQSRTWYEYPQVADVDGDGASELIVTCSTDDSLPFNPYSGSVNSQVRVYAAAAGEVWQPSRSVWNQHGYFNVNVNDDLTIPIQQQDHTIALADLDNCTSLVTDKPLNNYLNQAPLLNEFGCPEFATPDISLTGPITVTPSLCPDTEVEVSFTIENTGDQDLSGALPFTFYASDILDNSDNYIPAGERLNTEFEVVSDFLPGETLDITMTVIGPGGDFYLYVVVNDAGSNTPPFNLETESSISECDLSNNKGVTAATYEPFTLSREKLKDNEKCDPSLPDNGRARAFFSGTIPGITEVVWLEDFEDLSGGEQSDAGETAWSLSFSGNSSKAHVDNDFGGLAFVVNNSDAVATWTSETIDISSYDAIDISVDMFSSGDLETSADYLEIYYSIDGGSFTLLTNGRQLGNFGYFQALADDLSGSTLTIQAKAYNTSNDEFYYFDNIRVEGDTPPETGEFTDGFTFNWYSSGDYSSILYTGDTYASMAAGTYDVVGLYNSSNCYSDTLSVTIALDEDPAIDLVLYETQAVTNCTPPNGELTAGVVVGNDTIPDGYSFEWYIGESNNPDDFIGTGSVAGSLSARLYQVIVTDLTTGCTVSASRTPSTSILTPTLNLVSTTDITDCSDLNGGSALVSSPDDVTFEWYDGSSVKATPDETGDTYINLAAGTYTVVAIDNGSNCTSEPLQVEIENLTGAPNITTSVDANNSSCVAGNGQISAEASAISGDPTFTYEWFVGNSTSGGAALPAANTDITFVNDSTLSDVPTGTYTVRVTNNDNSCTNTALITVTDESSDPTINDVNIDITPRTACDGTIDPNNGEIDASAANVVNPSTGDYTFHLYEGTSAVGTPTSNTTGLFTGLDNGNYTLVVEDNDTGCESLEELLNVPFTPNTVTGVASDIEGNTFCIDGDGSVLITASSSSFEPTAGYDFSIYLGANTDPSNLISSETVTNGATGFTFDSLVTGAHRVEITNLENNCSDIVDITIPDAEEAITFDGSTNDNINCVDASGSASILTVNGSSNISEINDEYVFAWYDGDIVDAGNLRTDTLNSVTSLAAGDYTVVVTSNITGCESDPLTLTVEDDPFEFTVTIDGLPDSSCVVDNGALQAYAQDPDDPATDLDENGGYTFQWHLGDDTSTPIVSQDSSFASDLTPFQEYTVEVTHTATGCTELASFTVTQELERPTLSLDAMNPSTVCDTTGTGNTYDGSVSVAAIYEGASVTDFSNYQFTWYQGSSHLTDPVITGENDEELTNYPAGFYTVIAQNNADGGCESDPITVEITSNPNNPDSDLDATRTNNNTVCDTTTNVTGLFNGQISVTPVSGAITDYTFEWFVGASTDPSDEILANLPDAQITVTSTNAELSQLPGGTYTVLMTSLVNGCTFSEQYEIIDETIDPIIDGDASVVDNNTVCSVPGNGAIASALDLAGTEINGVENDEVWQAISSCNSVILDDATALGDNGFQLTTATNDQFGRIWLGDTLDLSQPLRLDFELYLGTKDATGADGIAFTMHRDPRGYEARGRVGGNLGVGDAATSSGTESKITPAVTVEFDTWQNGDVSDPTYDHTNLFLNGDVDVQTTAPTQIKDGEDNVETGDTLQVTLVVRQVGSEQNLQVWVDGSMRIEYQMNFIDDVFSGNSDVIAGFTSSTGGSNNDQFVIIKPYFDNFSFEWYDGNSVDDANKRSETDPFLCNLSGGDYTLQVTDNSTGCISTPYTFNVVDAGLVPDVIVNGSGTVNNGVCDPALATAGEFTGQITMEFNDGSDPANFTYEWFTGSSTDPSDQIAGADTLVLSGIEGGTYTCLITSNASSCQAIVEHTITDTTTDPVFPVAEATAVDVTVCLGGTGYPNGGVNVNEAGLTGSGDYTFEYYYGNSVNASNLLDDASDIFDQKGTGPVTAVNVTGSSTSSISGLDPGDYTVVVIDNETGCASTPVTVTVDDDPDLPEFEVSASDNNTVCDITENTSGDYDGSITVTPTDGSNIGDYTYTWYVGASTDAADEVSLNIASANIADNVLSEIPGGTYTVEITEDDNACVATIEHTINDVTSDPVLLLADATPVDVTVCLGGTGYPDGGITINEANITGGSGDYRYVYYYGSSVVVANELDDASDIFDQKGTGPVTAINVSGSTTSSITGLDAGDYTVVVVDNESGCTSTPVTVTVDDNPDLPEFEVSASDNNTVCDITENTSGDYDGSITVTPTDGSNIGDYTYTWYVGASTDAADEVSLNIATANIADNVLSEIPGGTYTVEITEDDNACVATIEHTINDVTSDPVLLLADATPVDVTVCLGGTGYPDGGININEANITGGSGDYRYVYYYGSSVVVANELDDASDIFDQKGTGPVTAINVSGSTTASITGLNEGDYTVVVWDNETGCSSAPVTVTVDDNPDLPEFEVSASDDNTVCDITENTSGDYDGSITVTPTDGSNVGDYTYTWYVGASTDAADEVSLNIATANIADNVLSEIPGGTYTVEITEDDNACVATIEHTINDVTSDPVLLLADATPVDVTVCLGGSGYPDGGININEANITGGSGDYRYVYYYGSSVVVANELDDASDIFDQKGTGPVTAINVSGSTTASITGLNEGDYTVVVWDNETGCSSAPVTVTVDDNPDLPEFEVSASDDNTVCDITENTSGDYDGSITVTPTDGSNVGDYTYTWYVGASTDAADEVSLNIATANIADNVLSEIPGGTYTVEITEDDNACVATIEHTINDVTSDPVLLLADATPVDVTVCLGGTGYPDGGININEANITGGSGDYRYVYYYGSSVVVANELNDADDIFDQKGTGPVTAINVSGSTTASITGLNEGDYTVVVWDNETGCSSAPVTVTVDDNPDQPEFDVTDDDNNTICDIALSTANEYNGSITVTPTDGSNVGDYTYTWFTGASTDPADEVTIGVPTADVSDNVLSEIPGGTYTVEITDADNACTAVIQHTINDITTDPTFDATAVKVDDMTVCEGGTNYPNGSIEVDEGAITGSGDYTFRYYFGSSAVLANQIDDSDDIFFQKGLGAVVAEDVTGSSTNLINFLNGGEYTIEVIDNETGCVSSPLTVTLEENPTSFTPAITVVSDQTSCDLGNPNGQLTATIAAGASTDANDYNFTWYQGQTTNAASEIPTSVLTSAVTSGTNGQTVTGLPSGTYTVLVTHITSNCSSTEEATIVLDNEDPEFSVAPAPTDNNSCSNPNGTITFTINDDSDGDGDANNPNDGAAGYTVELFDGPTIGVAETPLATITAADDVADSFDDLVDGVYSIRATDINTTCYVEELNITVGYNGYEVDIDPDNFYKRPISACFDQDGIINVDSTAVGFDGFDVTNFAGFTTGDNIEITWYAGTDTSGTANLIENVLAPNYDGMGYPGVEQHDVTTDDGVIIENGSIHNLPAIVYTGVVTLPNGCIEVFTTNLTLALAPTVDLTSSDPTRCATTFDGQIAFEMTVDAGNTPNQYRWFVFEGNQAILPDDDGSSPYDPDLTNYAPVVATGVFTDASAGGTELIDFNDNAVLGQLEAGDYTVGIDFLGDNCIVYTGNVTLADPPESSVTLDTKVDNSICDVTGGLSYNGSITVNASNPAGGTFDFTWYEDLDDNGTYDALLAADGSGTGLNVVNETETNVNTTTVTGLSAGKYRVIAIHNNNGVDPPGTDCPDTLDVEVFDNLTTLSVGNTPTVDWTLSHITDCGTQGEFELIRVLEDGAEDNYGAGNVAGNFTIVWTYLDDGSDVTPAGEVSSTTLDAGDYRIDLEEDATGCTTSYEFTIEDQTVNPTTQLVSKTPDTYCDGDNEVGDGTLVIDLFHDGGQIDVPLDPNIYTIEWYRGNAVLGTADPDFLFDNQGTGSGANLGSATANADFTELADLEEGFYTVYVIKDQAGATTPHLDCEVTATFEITSDQPVVTISDTDVLKDDNYNCSDENGFIEITHVYEDATRYNVLGANYTFSWEDELGNPIVGVAGLVATGTDNRIEDLPGGVYTVTATNTTTGCATSSTFDIEIDDSPVNPTVQVDTKTPDTYCDNTDNVGDGTLSVDIFHDGSQLDNPGPVDNAIYRIEWYRGDAVTTPADPEFLFDNQGNSNADLTVIGDAVANADFTELSARPVNSVKSALATASPITVRSALLLPWLSKRNSGSAGVVTASPLYHSIL